MAAGYGIRRPKRHAALGVVIPTPPAAHFPPAESPITSRTASSWPLPIATLNLRPAGTHPLVLRLATEACRTLEWASSVGLISGYAHVLFDETPSKVVIALQMHLWTLMKLRVF